MSLLTLPQLPRPPPMDSSSLKWNSPGPADSFLLSSQFPQLPCTLSFSFVLYLLIFLSPSLPLLISPFPLSFPSSVSFTLVAAPIVSSFECYLALALLNFEMKKLAALAQTLPVLEQSLV